MSTIAGSPERGAEPEKTSPARSNNTTQFLYDGDRLVAEYGSSGLAHRYVHGPSVDEPIVWYTGSGTTNRQWLHADERGSIVAVSSISGVGTEYTYGPYGEPVSWTGSRFRYTGQIALPELQLYHYRARVYDPGLGRFLQTDPIGYQDDANLYAYVRNDPVNNVDPTGTCTGSRITNDDGTCKGTNSFTTQGYGSRATESEEEPPKMTPATFTERIQIEEGAEAPNDVAVEAMMDDVEMVETMAENASSPRELQTIVGGSQPPTEMYFAIGKQAVLESLTEIKVHLRSAEFTRLGVKWGSTRVKASRRFPLAALARQARKLLTPESGTPNVVHEIGCTTMGCTLSIFRPR